jgi:hypothetical protein
MPARPEARPPTHPASLWPACLGYLRGRAAGPAHHPHLFNSSPTSLYFPAHTRTIRIVTPSPPHGHIGGAESCALQPAFSPSSSSNLSSSLHPLAASRPGSVLAITVLSFTARVPDPHLTPCTPSFRRIADLFIRSVGSFLKTGSK